MRIKNLLRPALFVIVYQTSWLVNAATCEYNILNEWGSGFTAQVTVTNNTTTTINGWSVTWSYTDGSTVPRTWDAALSGTNPYTATNLSYNSEITPNTTVTFGFNGTKGAQGAAAQVPALGGSCSATPPTNQAPVASITASATQGIVPFDVTFNASGSTDADNDALTYLWDFGNGDVATGVSVTRTYDVDGNFSVALTANDGTVDSAVARTTIVASLPQQPTNSYVLDAQNSSLYFVSTKRLHALETHTFTDLFGSISDTGVATLGINLSSIESGITVRNGRMREFLFEVATFPEATATVPVNLTTLAGMSVGSTQIDSIAATLDLHGVSAAIDTQVAITKISDSKIMVQNVSPILIKAADYGLDVGVDTLRGLANLSSISYTVPVNFTLVFNTPTAQ